VTRLTHKRHRPIEIPQRSSLLAYWGVLSFRSEAREVLIAVHTVQVSAANQAISRFATGTSGKAQTRQSMRRK
jgi:hypothetical protein